MNIVSHTIRLFSRTALIICYMLCTLSATAEDYGVTRRISSADGLSNDFVISMTTDGQGYIWVATEAGLNRIAGNTCIPLPNTPDLTEQRITALYWHQPTEHLLVGTETGLTIYSPKEGTSQFLNTNHGLASSSINDIVSAHDGGVWLVFGTGDIQHFDCSSLQKRLLRISHPQSSRCGLDDGSGHLYIGHSKQGMTIIDISNGSSIDILHDPTDAHSLPGNNVRCIFQDSRHRIWVGTDGGLALYHPHSNRFTKVKDANNDFDDNVYDICEISKGQLWIATDIGGIKVLDMDFIPSGDNLFYNNVKVKLSSLNTRSIIEDEFGNVWVGSHSMGVDFISSYGEDFQLLDFAEERKSFAPVTALAPDVEQGYWMAGESELAWWQNGKIRNQWSFLKDTHRAYSFPRCMMVDHSGYVWIGIDDQGVYRFNKRTEQFTNIPIDPDGSDIHSFAEMADGSIWIGGELGVYIYANGKATKHDYISRILHAPATSILQTEAQQLFIATLGDGVYSFNMKDNTYWHLNIRNGLPSGKINHTIRDLQGKGLWLATDGGLVHIADPIHLTGVAVYDKRQGLTDSHVLSVLQEPQQTGNDERIWLSTFSGISCFVKSKGKFYNYNHLDTHQSGGFFPGAAIIDHDSVLCFGSASGLCSLNLHKTYAKSYLSDVQIISCEAYNPVGEDTEILRLMPDKQGKIITTYRQNTIKLAFTMRNFAQTNLVDYSYRMKGMDDKWYDIGNDHDVVFRGLPPGSYTFILRAKLRNQDWSEYSTTQLLIIITPPFWRTWWAYIVYALLAITMIVIIVRLYKRKLILKSALKLAHSESMQKQNLNEERLRFFTNITHELRTPLTLILGPLEDLSEDKELSPRNRHRVSVIKKSAQQLKDLITEILEFRKAETQNRRLTVARGDIGHFVREICLSYKELNRNPKVDFICHIADDLPAIWFDSEVITTVVNNFLSNAVKYTEQGSITTTVNCNSGLLTISVADTGYGIEPEALPYIFNRYYQVKGSHQASGTGIGLALVKSLSILHEGEVSAESNKGQGAIFHFSIKIDNTYPNALHKEDPQPCTYTNEESQQADKSTGEMAEDTPPSLLVVEDNNDIRQYIADSFSDDFLILQAENGQEGLKIATEHIPDIIVSDIMMPKMNGIQMTQRLKTDIRTSHIPIILLTAKTTDEDKEEGYDSGADSFLTKPFTAKLLGSRMHNLLTARRRLAEQLSQHVGYKPREDHTDVAKPLSNLDQAFLNKMNSVIKDNIMSKDIDMTFITKQMAMSHSTFYRKVKALTGMTATEYIRKYRLQHCYNLLLSGNYNVNEAAMMTGFNQMAHFRDTFKKEFGILPSEVRNAQKSKRHQRPSR